MPGIGRGRPLVFAGVWLVYLLSPLTDVLHSDNPWRVVGVLALLGFAALFLVGTLLIRDVRRGEPAAQTKVWLLLGSMVVLLALAAPAGGQAVVGGAIYVAVLAVMALPGRVGAVVVVLVAVASEVVPRVVDGWSADNFFAFQVIVASFAAWGITQVIARNADLLRAREEIARLAVADERARMSRDLHDILGHSLTVITVKAELAGRLAEVEGAPQARSEIGDVERLAREALADVRATVGGMRGVTLAGELAGARTALEAAGIDAHLPSSVDDVPVAWRELFAWTVREGVTNVVRHSHAERCVVRLSAKAVEVQDDGCGPAYPAPGRPGAGTAGANGLDGAVEGHGLAGLRERAVQLGARMSVGSGASADGLPGFVLRVEVPA
jgi:two-component system sensor histidine kinase DesK